MSISKAITHKHKLHPDHDAKYFCPWCGKLFTMKHLYSKHIRTNHAETEKKNDKYFPCDSCNVSFNVPAAMLYHNKFFHRQDTDLPTIGTSKKLKIYNQEVVQIYYCPFCGEEFENKVNLHKHIGDDHNDENQRPDEVLRCPLCEAVFYHLDAYELHLTHHSIEDMYSERNEMADQITDFSLESVPPVTETVENLEALPDDDNDKIGIEQLLEFAMDEPKEKKSKKHKKHKKSKKSITLDEFLNMNKDVFGEEIDFQGVEEVPTQAVTKRIRPKKSGPTKLPPDIEKLKNQGIVIKKKTGANIPIKKGTFKVPHAPNTLNRITIKPESNTNKLTSNEDVLSKLLNQTNSQIKIVKKTTADTPKVESDDETSPKLENTNAQITTKGGDNVNETLPSNQEKLNEKADPATVEIANTMTNDSNHREDNEEHSSDTNSVQSSQNIGALHLEDIIETKNNSVDPLKLLKNNINIVMKSTKSDLVLGDVSKQSIEQENEDNIDEHIPTEEIPDAKCDQKNDSLKVLKHLNHLTVKSNKQNISLSKEVSQECQNERLEQRVKQKINKPEIIKEPIPLPFRDEIKEEENNETSDTKSNLDNNIAVKKDTTAIKNPQLNVQTAKMSTISSPKENQETTASNTSQSSLDLLKHLKNVTAKPVSKITQISKAATPQLSPKIMNIKQEPKPQQSPPPKKEEEEIEIFSIDDSDDDEGPCKRIEVKTPTIARNINNIKTLNKNLTIKSLNQRANDTNNKIKKEPVAEEYDEGLDEVNVKKEPNKSVNKEPSVLKNIKRICENGTPLNNMLKNLSKNITIKSRNSSPQNVKCENTDNCNFNNNLCDVDSDSDQQPGNVKITEVENASDDDLPTKSYMRTTDNVKIQYPDESESDHDSEHKEFDGQFSDEDIESQIKATKMDKNILKSADNPNLNSLQKLSKNITIKSSKQINENPENIQMTALQDVPLFAKSLSKQIIKNSGPSSNKNNEMAKVVSNAVNMEQRGSRSTSQLVNQKMMSNQVNKKEVKTVKTFKSETQTVIEEITTTVTKTIKTVNQTTKQETVKQSSSAQMRLQTPQQIRPQKNYQGLRVRQAAPVVCGNTIRTQPPSVRAPRNIRPGNQLVPVRPGINAPRLLNPRMAGPKSVKLAAAAAAQKLQNANSPALALPSSGANKRQSSEEPTAHFSCFKKPKESLIPISDVPVMKNSHEPSVQYSSVQMNKSNFSCTTTAVKGNSVKTSTQMRSEASASSQHLSKLQGMSGLSVVKTSQMKQAVVEKSEISATQKSTLDAIQKLQSQGLLIKKPRVDVSQDDEFLDPGSDEAAHNSNEEYDE